MTLHTERTFLDPLDIMDSDGTATLSPVWQRILLRNAHEGNANVTIVDDDMTEICLFVIKGELYGVLLTYRTQVFTILSLQEIIDWYRTKRIHALLLEYNDLEDRREVLCQRSTEGPNGLDFHLTPDEDNELKTICARLTELDKTDWC